MFWQLFLINEEEERVDDYFIFFYFRQIILGSIFVYFLRGFVGIEVYWFYLLVVLVRYIYIGFFIFSFLIFVFQEFFDRLIVFKFLFQEFLKRDVEEVVFFYNIL